MVFWLFCIICLLWFVRVLWVLLLLSKVIIVCFNFSGEEMVCSIFSLESKFVIIWKLKMWGFVKVGVFIVRDFNILWLFIGIRLLSIKVMFVVFSMCSKLFIVLFSIIFVDLFIGLFWLRWLNWKLCVLIMFVIVLKCFGWCGIIIINVFLMLLCIYRNVFSNCLFFFLWVLVVMNILCLFFYSFFNFLVDVFILGLIFRLNFIVLVICRFVGGNLSLIKCFLLMFDCVVINEIFCIIGLNRGRILW